MSRPKLRNYLRTHRKRTLLSQDEMAYLLGAGSGAKTCRHERFIRAPSLETALAYEAVFQKPVSELFAGLYQRIEREVAARAEVLLAKMNSHKSRRKTSRKRQVLEELVARHKSKDTQKSE